MNTLIIPLLSIICGLIIGFMIGRIVTAQAVKMVRKEAITSSHKVILGGVYEKILPALPSFPYAPKDMTFLGKGVDYLIFDGLSEGRLREIIFLELKSGKSQLNRNEQMIRDCINARKVRYAEYRIGSRKE